MSAESAGSAGATESVEPVDLDRMRHDIDACAASQRALSEHLLNLRASDIDHTAPSVLPDWSVGHVLTHIARNADSVLRMLDGLPQYWMGVESRAADIQLGASRPWDALVDDVVTTSAAVEARMREVAEWSGSIATVFALRPKAMLPIMRRREVEIHRSDLGLGYGFADMPGEYIRTDTRLLTMQWTARQPMGLTPLPDAVLAIPEHDRLAWLFGRIDVPGVEPARVY